jgi:anion-transporting  ArsA/GET3 family ATPase
MASLLDRRLLVVTGKGGVGKTTVAAALGLLAARAGKRAVICEVAGQDRCAALFGVEHRGHEEVELAPGLRAVSIDPDRAKREYLERQLHSGALAGILGHSRVFQLLTAAAPGLNELTTIGKIWDLAQLERRTAGATFDIAIVDSPATGHGLALLEAPRTYTNLARMGPIHRQALQIDRFLRDRKRTALLGVALPEEMPVNETIDLEGRLAAAGLRLDGVVMNGLYPRRFSAKDVERIAGLDGDLKAGARAALRAALSEHARAASQHAELRRLRKRLTAPVSTLPYLFESELGRAEVERLSHDLEAAL